MKSNPPFFYTHRLLTYYTVPRRKDGNKLGLRKRKLLLDKLIRSVVGASLGD